MPRPSLNYDVVATAAANLVAAGVTATLKNVRDELGGGSMSSIQPHLKKWSEAQPRASAAAFEVPGRLRDALASEFARIAADARVDVEARLQQTEADNADLAAAGQRAEEELEEVRTELARMTTERDTLAGKNSEQGAEIARLNGEVGRAREETDQARQKLARAEIRLEALGDLQTQNEALRNAIAEANAKTAQAEKGQAVAEAKWQSELEAKNSLMARVLEAEEQVKAASEQHRELHTRYEALHERHISAVIAEGEARTELSAVRTELGGLKGAASTTNEQAATGQGEAKVAGTKGGDRTPTARRK